MAGLISNVQDRFRVTTNMVMLWLFKLFSGILIGLTLALIGVEILQYGVFSFVLIVVVVTASLLRIAKSWSWTHVFIFNLICVLLGLLLRMYILIAPNA